MNGIDFDGEQFFVLPPELLKTRQQSLIEEKAKENIDKDLAKWKADRSMALQNAVDRLSPYFWKGHPFPYMENHPIWKWINAAPLKRENRHEGHRKHAAPMSNSEVAFKAIEQIALAISSHSLPDLSDELANKILSDANQMGTFTKNFKDEEERQIAANPKRTRKGEEPFYDGTSMWHGAQTGKRDKD